MSFPEDVTPYLTTTLSSDIPILPIFSPACFASDINYPSLSLALRLSSLSLQSPHALRFLYVLFFSKRQPFLLPSGQTCLETLEDPSDGQTLTPFQTQLVLTRLSQLSQIITWYIDDPPTPTTSPSNPPPEPTTTAETHPNPSLTSPFFPQGFGSDIFLPSSLLHHRSTSPTPDLPSHLISTYHLTHILIHELAHAISNAVDGDVDPEIFFPSSTPTSEKNNWASELGFAAEEIVFGGVLERVQIEGAAYVFRDQEGRLRESGEKQGMARRRWPDKGIVEMYLRWGDRIGVRGEVPREGDGDEGGVLVVLPFERVWGFFQRGFWEETVVRLGRDAFKLDETRRLEVVERVEKRRKVTVGVDDGVGEEMDCEDEVLKEEDEVRVMKRARRAESRLR